jgi:hypothetical protein
MKTEYEKFVEEKLSDPEFKIKYLLEMEKLNIELLLYSVKESIEENQDKKIVINKLNNVFEHLNKISVAQTL